MFVWMDEFVLKGKTYISAARGKQVLVFLVPEEIEEIQDPE